MGESTGAPGVVGRNIRVIRTERGLSQRALAERARVTHGYLSKVERGLANPARRTLLDVADALKVPPAKLTGQPYDARTRAEERIRVAAADLRDILHGNAIGDPAVAGPGRDIDQLRAAVTRALDLYAAGAVEDLGEMIPAVLADLYAHTAGGDADAAVALLPPALNAAWNFAHWAGEAEVAHRGAEHAAAAAELTGDPAAIGYAAFGVSHTLIHVNGPRARARGRQVAVAAAGALEQHAAGGPPAEMFGMLHLTAAWVDLLVGDGSDVAGHLAAAQAAAVRTGDGSYGRLWFGPANVAAWQVALAVEAGDGGRVPELAAAVDLAGLRGEERKSGHLINVGLGLAQEPATAGEVIAVFRRARRLTPTRVRWHPQVRSTVDQLLYEVGGPDVRTFAVWLGLIER